MAHKLYAVKYCTAAFSGAVMLLALSVLAQVANAQDKPVYTEYKGISIGMKTADVREKLGKAKDETDAEDYYEFSDDESVRILYDAAKTVRAISINYMGKLDSAPTPMAVIGRAIEPKADGAMYKMVHYRKDGFWISYVKTAGDDPMVIITMQRLDR